MAVMTYELSVTEDEAALLGAGLLSLWIHKPGMRADIMGLALKYRHELGVLTDQAEDAPVPDDAVPEQ